MNFSEWWRDGDRAWRRMSAHTSGPVSGDDALGILADIGALRRVLDQVELSAVRTARQQSKSWTEIATGLGVTRQSAWERWREIDQKPAEESAAERAMTYVVERGSRVRKRQARVRVPEVVGSRWPAAYFRLIENDLAPVSATADPPTPEPTDEGWIVYGQAPESGARVQAGSAVRLWLRRDGDSGVREPRHPRPTPRRIPETTPEAMGEPAV